MCQELVHQGEKKTSGDGDSEKLHEGWGATSGCVMMGDVEAARATGVDNRIDMEGVNGSRMEPSRAQVQQRGGAGAGGGSEKRDGRVGLGENGQ